MFLWINKKISEFSDGISGSSVAMYDNKTVAFISFRQHFIMGLRALDKKYLDDKFLQFVQQDMSSNIRKHTFRHVCPGKIQLSL